MGERRDGLAPDGGETTGVFSCRTKIHHADRGDDADAGVKRTNADAQVAKLSCVLRGYFVDDYVKHFVDKADAERIRSMPPLINRGYYARHVMVKSLLMHFLTSFQTSNVDTSPQVVVLGCGFDTLYFQLRKTGELAADVRYIECDFPDVVAMKRSIMDGIGLQTQGSYSLIGSDVRKVDELVARLDESGVRRDVPTFFLAECVLVYMDVDLSNELLRRIASNFETAMCTVYEQVNPKDAFGRQMMVNLQARGCPLKGVLDSLEDQRQRMLQCGWKDSRSENLLQLFNSCIPRDELTRINRLEMLDEEEEWNLLLQHYCITTARNSDAIPLFRDIL